MRSESGWALPRTVLALEVGHHAEIALTSAALTALQAKKALDVQVAGTAGAPGKPAPTGQTGSGKQ